MDTIKLDGFGNVELEGFGDIRLEEFNIELKRFTFIDTRSIGNINRVIELLGNMKASKEVTQCIELLQEVKTIEGLD